MRDRTGELVEDDTDDDWLPECNGAGWLNRDGAVPCPRCWPWLVEPPRPRPPTRRELAAAPHCPRWKD